MSAVPEVAAYVAARREFERLARLEDAAFVRWFTGKVQNGSAAARAANRTSMFSADLACAEDALYRVGDRNAVVSVDLDLVYAWETS